MFAEMIVLEHRRRVHLQRGEFDKAAEIAKLMDEKTEEFRRERANIVRELRQRLAVALERETSLRPLGSQIRLMSLSRFSSNFLGLQHHLGDIESFTSSAYG